MRSYRLAAAILAAFLLLLAAGPAAAEELTGQQILENSDAVRNAAKDMVSETNLTLVDSEGREKKQAMITAQKGDEKRVMKYTQPPDLKDVAVLALDEGDTIYNYLPSMRKIRRIAAHVKDTNFAGTDFTYDDTATLNFKKDYSAKLTGGDDKHYELELTPLPDAEVGYTKLKMWVTKDGRFLTDKIEYYQGDLKKIQTLTDYVEIKGYWLFKKAEMRDVKRSHTTTMDITKLDADVNLPDDVFTQRYLKTGRFDFVK